MPAIARVRVVVDDNIPENVEGLLHCRSVISLDEQFHEIADFRQLLESAEFRSEAELIGEVARRGGVDPSIVEIAR